MTIFHIIWTLGLLAVFIYIAFWSYSSRRREDFEQASRLPLDDEIYSDPATIDDQKVRKDD